MAFAVIFNYIKGHNGVVAFDDYSYNAAFEMGYFDDEARAQDLDSIQYLEEGGLPIPEALHANLTTGFWPTPTLCSPELLTYKTSPGIAI